MMRQKISGDHLDARIPFPCGTWSSHAVFVDWWAEAVERGLEHRLEVVGVAVDFGDRGDHVEDLLEREIVADLVGVLRRGRQRPTGGERPGAASAPSRRIPGRDAWCSGSTASSSVAARRRSIL